jgi:tRNA A37 methylthiotransferase MiaB
LAASLPNPVPASVKKLRAEKMRRLGAGKKKQFCLGFQGRRMAVLIEEKIDKKSGCHRGFTRNYLPVIVSGNAPVNQQVDVRIDGYDGDSLTGSTLGEHIFNGGREDRSGAGA